MAAPSHADTLEGIRVEAKVAAPRLDVSQLSAETHIADAGIDSLQMLELVGRLEARFDISIPDYELAGVETVGNLIQVVERSRAEAS